MEMKNAYEIAQEYLQLAAQEKALATRKKELASLLKETAKSAGGSLDLGDIQVGIVTSKTYKIRPAAIASKVPEVGLALFKVDTTAIRKVVPEKLGVTKNQAMDFILSRLSADEYTVASTERLQVKPKAL